MRAKTRDWIDWVEGIVSKFQCPWGIRLEVRMPHDYLEIQRLMIFSHWLRPNTRGEGEIDVMSNIYVRDFDDEDIILGMIRRMIQDKVLHEIDEQLTYDGEKRWYPAHSG